ncbi:Triple functional domain protein [Actinoplanes sp. SE50]|uniref:hypothetical protein n=1 Tax=unclassified Actinoplanes TaxID=2626549 RepID=UPI00023EC57E|nr:MULTISPECIES: hypothetical protein [unclassified Actinoplanes]AEV81937.1 Triple functional domain protein [Actinoplanes sp. SE50/110]ATO80337.1 Triple functional domain protein [Actinoplanes sp. SE50]SLL97743.1 Triple functional domain protein [Actinoplanes sp. SE50/110]
MRHLRSIVYALVLAPAAWILAGVGFTHDLTSRGRDFFTAESLSGLLLLIFAGVLYGIMILSPISPAGPTLAGAAYMGTTWWAWTAPKSYAGIWPAAVVKDGFDLSRPAYGLAALLAVPLLCTALSARRWARYEPPVLPIIGEIGRFRGSARVAGDNVAAIETTVLRTSGPAPSRHPAPPAAATQIIPPPAAVSARPAAPQTAAPQTAIPKIVPSPRTVAPQDDKTRLLGTPSATPQLPTPAGEPAVPATAGDPTTPSVGSVRAASDDATVTFAAATTAPKSNKSGITTNSAITAGAEKSDARPPVSDLSDEKTVTLTAAAKPAATPAAAAKPAAAATPAAAANPSTTPAAAMVKPLPAATPNSATTPGGTTAPSSSAAKSEPDSDDRTVLFSAKNVEDEETEVLSSTGLAPAKD